MAQHPKESNTKKLWVLSVLGIAYSSFLYFEPGLTGSGKAEGMIGVLFGLYLCSHPASHMVEMLFFRRTARPPFPSARSTLFWVAINIIVLFVGWTVLFVGTTRLIGRGD